MHMPFWSRRCKSSSPRSISNWLIWSVDANAPRCPIVPPDLHGGARLLALSAGPTPGESVSFLSLRHQRRAIRKPTHSGPFFWCSHPGDRTNLPCSKEAAFAQPSTPRLQNHTIRSFLKNVAGHEHVFTFAFKSGQGLFRFCRCIGSRTACTAAAPERSQPNLVLLGCLVRQTV